MRCALLVLLGCSGTPATFRPTDPSFRPSPGPLPRVYLEANADEFPREGVRSVGLIQVKAPEGTGMKRLIELAAKKGRELGCWIVVEHSVFERLKTALDHGARALPTHGPVPHIGAVSPGTVRAEFDCVVRVTT